MEIIIAGAGSIGTALGHILTGKQNLNVSLLTNEPKVAETINKENINQKYFPNIKLDPKLKATTNARILQQADVIFLAIPSVAVVDYLIDNRTYINDNCVIVNLAKGFGKENKTIPQNLEVEFTNTICTLKGPTFAREMANNSPTSFTLASRNKEVFKLFSNIFSGTNIFLDFSTDVIGTELSSILKNIYAIILGIVDAHFNSSNLRFLILTQAFNEMKTILEFYGGKRKTMFKYCGYGDFGLTALNDLSRNRTLGLLIGKGFFTKEISDKVVLEGKIAVNIFYNKLSQSKEIHGQYPMLEELYKIFNEDYDTKNFVNIILSRERILLNDSY